MLHRRLRAVCDSPEMRSASALPPRKRRALLAPSDSESEEQFIFTAAPEASSAPARRSPRPDSGGDENSANSEKEHFDELVNMGFEPGVVRCALQFAGGDMNAAVEICLQTTKPASAVAAPPSNSRDAAPRRQISHSRTHESYYSRALPVFESPPQPAKAYHPEPLRGIGGKRGRPATSKSSKSSKSSKVGPRKRKLKRQASSSSEEWRPSSDESTDGLEDARISRQYEEDDSGDSSCDAKERGPRLGTKALREISATAQTVLVDALSGPDKTNNSEGVRQRRVDVKQTMSHGCTKLKTDYWETCNDPPAKSACFKLLKEHQRVGVRWLYALHPIVPGMILADEMGLGKTLQTLCFLEMLAAKRPSLVIAPATVLETWESEAARWTPGLCTLKYHASRQESRNEIRAHFFQNPRNYKLVITTPQVFNCKLDRDVFFRKVDFEYLIYDEAHGLKNSNSCRYREISKVVKSSRRLLLTGTPVQNSLGELATLLGFALSAEKGRRVSAELQEISEGHHEKALRQLQAAAAPLILRRLKADVLTELPTKRGVVVYCEMEGVQREMYDNELAACRKPSILTGARVKDAFHKLRRISLHPLMGKNRLSKEQNQRLVEHLCQVRPDYARVGRERAAREVETWSDFEKHQAATEHGLGDEFRASTTELMSSAKVVELLRILREKSPEDGKTLVFSQFTQYLDIVQAALWAAGVEFIRLDGHTVIQERSAMVAGFQGEGGPRVFLISTKAGGVGLNLTAASTVIMLDLDFNPQNSRQAEDRVHRLGQSRQVTVYYLICRGTVEDMVLQRNVDKMQLDRQFGARHTAFEAAVDEAREPKAAEGMSCADAEAHAKQCERAVMQQLQQLLRAPAAPAAAGGS